MNQKQRDKPKCKHLKSAHIVQDDKSTCLCIFGYCPWCGEKL